MFFKMCRSLDAIVKVIMLHMYLQFAYSIRIILRCMYSRFTLCSSFRPSSVLYVQCIMLKNSPNILSRNSKNNHLLFFYYSYSVPNNAILFLWQLHDIIIAILNHWIYMTLLNVVNDIQHSQCQLLSRAAPEILVTDF